ncbi:MAG: hypothetical protein EOO59_07995, partial [Hymenobacter sp.]
MKLLLCLLLLPFALRAQQVYENYQHGFSLRYPAAGWQLAAPLQPRSSRLTAGTRRIPDAELTVAVEPVATGMRGLSLAEQRAAFLAEAHQKLGTADFKLT